MQSTKIQNKKNAFALAIVIWIVAALLLGIAFIMNLAKDNLKITENLDEKLQTHLETLSFLEVLKYAMITSNYDSQSILLQESLPFDLPKQLILDGRKYNIGKNIEFSLQDSSGQLSVFHPNFELIARFTTDDREKYFTIKDSIWDWIDKDNIVRLNGAESSFYKFKRSVSYGPRNYSAIQSMDELQLINGLYDLDKKEWDKVKSFMSIEGSPSLNVVLMKKKLLKKLLNLNSTEIDIIEAYKKTDIKKFYREMGTLGSFDNEFMGYALSFLIDVNLTIKKGISATHLESIIGFKEIQNDKILVKSFKVY